MLIVILTIWSMVTLSTSQIAEEQNQCPERIKKGKLRLTESEIATLPDFCDCEVDRLHLKKGKLDSIPSCYRLKELKLEAVAFSEFPLGILEQSELKALSLQNSEIEYLPNGLKNLTALERLDLRNTGLAELPDGLDHIEVLDLRMNSFNKETQEALRRKYPNAKIFFSSPCNCP